MAKGKRSGGKATGTRRTSTQARSRPKKAAPRKAPPSFPVPEGWSLDKGGKSLSLALKTKDFLDALAVMNEVGFAAEELEHHPDFHLEKWNHLRITTYSHDVGHLTDRDERLAQRINEVLAKRDLGL